MTNQDVAIMPGADKSLVSPAGSRGFAQTVGLRRMNQPDQAEAGGTVRTELPAVPLPFAHDALRPLVSEETMHFHYDKHYLGYLQKVNDAAPGLQLDRLGLEVMIGKARDLRQHGFVANAGQTWNHGFFWQSLSVPNTQNIDALLQQAIVDSFGSMAAFVEKFVAKGSSHVGSGWVWLCFDPTANGGSGKLVIATTPDAVPVWFGKDRGPILVCDIWEHAYYLDWRNDRAGWLKAFISNLANWRFASSQYAALKSGGVGWRYPNPVRC